tara:strand:- start:44 stop:394 length:351 start_codon:yes stop_codon:yes gene_type:complete
MNTIHIYILFILFFIGCKDNAELTMERGIQYYEWEMIEKSILEFKKVIHMYPADYRTLEYDEVRLLSQAHHNLAIAYAKKEWYDDAKDEARKAFELIPTQENRRVLDLIDNKKFIQ